MTKPVKVEHVKPYLGLVAGNSTLFLLLCCNLLCCQSCLPLLLDKVWQQLLSPLSHCCSGVGLGQVHGDLSTAPRTHNHVMVRQVQ